MLGPEKLQIPPPDEWTDFESMVSDLFESDLGRGKVQKHGRQGQNQHGVDLIGKRADGGIVGVQCKKKDVIAGHVVTVKEFRKEVRKAEGFQPRLAEFVLATTAPDDGTLQREALRLTGLHEKKGLFSVRVEGWNSIKKRFGDFPHVFDKYYGTITGKMTLAFDSSQPMPEKAIEPNASPKTKSAPLVLSSRVSHAFGLLATISLPVTRQMLESLFPTTEWKATISELAKGGVIAVNEGVIEVKSRPKRAFFKQPEDRKPFDEEWVKALEPLRDHIDAGLWLATIYPRLKRVSDTITLLVELSEGVEPGAWADGLWGVIKGIGKDELLAKLTDADRLSLIYAAARCLSVTEHFFECREWTERLRHESERQKSSWHRAEADLLTGITFSLEGKSPEAIQYFRLAAKRATKHGHHLIEGHALNNLVSLVAANDPIEAEEILKESLQAKKKAGLEDMGVGALIGFGQLAVSRREFQKAASFFKKAAKLAESVDDRYGRSIAECNVASAFADMGKLQDALSHYRLSREIASKEGYAYPLRLATRGLAVALSNLKRYKQAEKMFHACVGLEKAAKDGLAMAVGIHDIGVMLLHQKKYEQSRKTFRRAGQEAQNVGDEEWTYLSARDECYSYRDQGNVKTAWARFGALIKEFRSARQYSIAARLSEDAALLWVKTPNAEHLVANGLREASELWEMADSCSKELWECLTQLFSWQWDHGDFTPAIEALRKAVDVAQKGELREQYCRSLDQLGVSCQELGKFDEAENPNREALKLARRLKCRPLVQNTLNNLGELYRKTNRPKMAESLFLECEQEARSAGDKEAAISTAQNRALLLLDSGREREAMRVLRSCLDRARDGRFWNEYVRALRGIADHAWRDGQPEKAESGYRRAIKVALKHKLDDHLYSARINLGWLLMQTGRPHAAIAEFEDVRPQFRLDPSGTEYLSYLAGCYEEVRDFRKAHEALQQLTQQALANGENGVVTSLAISEAKLHAKAGDYDRANTELKSLYRRAKGQERVEIASGGIECAIEQKDFKGAEEWATKMSKTTSVIGHSDDEIDAYMQLGDALWETGTKRADGATYHVIAGLCALESNPEAESNAYWKVMLHLILKLVRTDATEQDEARSRVAKWIENQFGRGDSGGFLETVLWPFQVAKRISPDANADLESTLNRIIKAVGDEFRSARQ